MQASPELGCSTREENINKILFIAVKNSIYITCLYNNSFVEAWGCREMEKSVKHAVNHIWVRCLEHELWGTFFFLGVVYDNRELACGEMGIENV